jgi:hypothetical protein
MSLAFPKPLPREPKKKGGRRTERAQEKNVGDAAWKLTVKVRAGMLCEMAGKHHRCWGPLDAHHVIGKGAHPRLRLDLENGVALCRDVHSRVHRSRWFRPFFWAWFDSTFPGRRERLLQKAAREGRLA